MVVERHPRLVTLNVYDLDFFNNFNFLADALGGSGAFHGGIECYFLEWSYGYAQGASGVHPVFPGKSSLGKLKTKLILGYTTKNLNEFLTIIEDLYFDKRWNGVEYDVIHHNCQHFSQHL